MKKLLLCYTVTILLIILCANFLSAADSITSYGTVKQNECITWTQKYSNATYTNFTSLTWPNQSKIILLPQIAASKSGSEYYYESCNYSSVLGDYEVCGTTDVDGVATDFCVSYSVTYLGKELSAGQATLSIGFLTILILILIVNFIGIGMLPSRNQTDEEGRILSITYLKYFRNVLWMTGYFLFIGIVYISSNLAFAFLSETLIANTLFMIFRVSFGLAPIVVILWIIWIFVSMFHDKQFQKMLNRGIFPGGNL